MFWACTLAIKRAVLSRTLIETFTIIISFPFISLVFGCAERLRSCCELIRHSNYSGLSLNAVFRNLSLLLSYKEGIQRPSPGANDQQKDEAQ